MSEPASRPGTNPPATLTPLLKALKTRDQEGLSKLRHALRTPLNQIIGYAELLMENAEESGANTLAGEINSTYDVGCFGGPPGTQFWTFALQRL